VGETSRYFTIILPPTVVDVAAKLQGEKNRSNQVEREGRERERVAFGTSIRDIGRIAGAKVRKMRKIVDTCDGFVVRPTLYYE
jgi:hypothetical protein